MSTNVQSPPQKKTMLSDMINSFSFRNLFAALALAVTLTSTGCLAPKLGDPSLDELPASGRHLKKVHFFWLDHQGQYSEHPSMFERDAYQAYLRENPEEIHGLRVAILVAGTRSKLLTSKLELLIQGPPSPDPREPLSFELNLSERQDRKLRRWIYWDIDPVIPSSSATTPPLHPESVVSWQLTLFKDGMPQDRIQSYLWRNTTNRSKDGSN